MNPYFDKEKIEELYPEAGPYMWPPQLVWSLPAGKEDKLDEMLANGEYFASLKKDGACYQFVKTEHYSYLFGRTVSRVTGLLTEKGANVPHIMQALDCLPAGTVLVMEIYYPGGSSKDTTSIMGCLPAKAIERQKDKPIHAYIHDILYWNGEDLRNKGALDRYLTLKYDWNARNFSSYDFLELAQPVFDNILEEANKALAAGEEGMVLRKKDGIWEPGKRPAWRTIKIKQHDTIDLVVTRLIDATKEYTGKELETWQYWEQTSCDGDIIDKDDTCHYGETNWWPVTKYAYYGWKTAIGIGAYDSEGKLIELGTVSSGLTDFDKQDMTENPDNWLNHVVALDCMSINKKDHTLRHPAFKMLRNDKNAKDCKISEVFI